MSQKSTKGANHFFLKLLCLFCFLVACEPLAAQEVGVITVNGRVLSGTNSSAQMRGGRLLLPVASIARVLGDTLQVGMSARTVSVRRQTGVSADFNAELNQVLENGAVILVIPGSNDLVFPPSVEELMMPAEIVASLLDVSIRRDQNGSIVITRGGGPPDTVRSGAKHPKWELFQLEYDYNFNRYLSSTDHGLTLRGTGRIGSGRFTFLTNSVSGTPGTRLIGLQTGNFRLELPTGQNFVAGDFGTGTDLEFMSSTVRGGAATLPYKNVRVNVFAGRAISGTVGDLSFPLLPDGEVDVRSIQTFRYDTSIFGGSVTTGSDLQTRSTNNLTFSAGAMHFAGSDRKGDVVSGSVRYASERSRFQADLAGGNFSGTGRDNLRVAGSGIAVNTSGSIRLLPQLLLQGRYAYINQNFLSPQNGLHEPLNLKAAGVTWQPRTWLTAGFSGSTASRPGRENDFNRFWSATLNVTPDNGLPSVFFSHTQSATMHLKNSAFTLINVNKQIPRGRMFLNGTRVKTSGLTTLTGVVGGSFRINESNTLDVNQSFSNRAVMSGMVNWQTAGLFYKHLSLGGGLGYSRSETSFRTTEHFSASLRLPRQSSIQFSFVQTLNGPTMLFSLHGLLISSRRAERTINGPIEEVDSYGAVYGRVYQDANLNGRFDPGIDLPQANVKVRVDGNRYVVSDLSGNFRIDNVLKGEHSVYLDLLSVRADLTLLDSAQQQISLDSKRDSIVDFRLVRTGRVSGVVWLDTNENGQLDKDEQALAGVRVVTGSGRDTLTDSNGYFLIGDLPPGEHLILLDQKTLPEQKRSVKDTSTIKIIAGSETEMTFPVITIPVNVKRFPGN